MSGWGEGGVGEGEEREEGIKEAAKHPMVK